MFSKKILCGCLLLIAPSLGHAQTYTVTIGTGTGVGSLPYAISLANAGSVDVIDIQSGLGLLTPTAQMFVNANVTIQGNGNAIDMNLNDRAFFLAGGTITISDLTIGNGVARGGNGAYGGGGGAGLGGAIFIANGAGYTDFITLPTQVTLSNVTLTNNSAIGGNGSSNPYFADPYAWGGGGGMGGHGGLAYNEFLGSNGGGGGGGLGNGANGGNSDPDNPQNGGAGIFLPGNSSPTIGGGHGSSDASGDAGGLGGLNGGGGGGANAQRDDTASSGGGGGVGGQSATYGSDAGNGGFGGGGGGADPADENAVLAGNGGFGGGGGGGAFEGVVNGVGGFGGGGGETGMTTPNPGGFGGGNAQDGEFSGGGGGGGMGAGGAVFVMLGATLNVVDSTFAANAVTGGAGASAPATGGSAIGANLFLGADTTITVSGTNTMTLSDLGGAGNLSDPNVSDHASDPDAQGGLIKAGTGTLALTGANYYTGTTTVNAGTLDLQGTSTGTGYVVNSGGMLLITGDGNTLPNVEINSGGGMTVSSGVQNLEGHIVVNTGGLLELNISGSQAYEVGVDLTGRVFGTGGAGAIRLENGGVLAPGDETGSGDFSTTNLYWQGGGTVELVLGAGYLVTLDLMQGDSGSYEFLFSDLNGVQLGETYALLAYGTTDFALEDFSFSSLVGGLDGQLVQYHDDALDSEAIGFQVTAVPEPATWVLLGLGLGYVLWRKRSNVRAAG